MRTRPSAGAVAILGILLVTMFGSFASGEVMADSSQKTFNNQSYFGTLQGTPLWQNASFPFASYTVDSHVLSLPSVRAFIQNQGYSISQLKPYLSLYPSGGNPFDFAQTTVTINGSTSYVYEYMLPNGTVDGFWIPEASVSTVAHTFTYTPADALQGTIDNPAGTGLVAHDTSQAGAAYNTKIWSDLTSPPTCGSDCWFWDDWLGTSNYQWPSAGSGAFFFQGEILYWGGNEGQPSGNCGSTAFSPHNCEFFQYVLNGGSLQTTAPGVGGWGNNNGVTVYWLYGNSNCTPSGGGGGNTIDLTIDDTSTTTTTTSSECFPIGGNTYADFIGERIGSTTNAKFSSNPHSLTGFMYDGNHNPLPLNSGGSGQPVTEYLTTNNFATVLASVNHVSNGAFTTTWNENWNASSDQ